MSCNTAFLCHSLFPYSLMVPVAMKMYTFLTRRQYKFSDSQVTLIVIITLSLLPTLTVTHGIWFKNTLDDSSHIKAEVYKKTTEKNVFTI